MLLKEMKMSYTLPFGELEEAIAPEIVLSETLLIKNMSKLKATKKSEFNNIIQLIEEARSRAFNKVNAELVLLYFNVGKIVSSKVADGIWGEGTVDELANYIADKMPGIGGFNRRGLYRMKQFYETYSIELFVSPLATLLQTYSKNNTESQKVSAVPTQLKKKKPKQQKVSALPAQIRDNDFLHQQFVSSVLTQISWANHLEILSGTKSPEEKLFYMVHSIKERWSMIELRRQLSTGYFESTMMSNTIVSAVRTQLPENFFKDPYI